MMTAYVLINDHLEKTETLSGAALWIDLMEPTAAEEAAVEALLGIDVPTREEMQEIEASSRLYRENEALFLTISVLAHSDTPRPQNTPITFILTRACTVTVRYATPQPFLTFAARATRIRGLTPTAEAVLLGLLDQMIDRLADVLERVGTELDTVSHEIFQTPNGVSGTRIGGTDFHHTLSTIGRNGDLASKARDSLLGIARAISFLTTDNMLKKDARLRLKTMTRDVRSLTEHVGYVSTKVGFLFDATLGMINIEQNNIIKIFSIVAVMAMPPTLIASLYGMNFKYMPELDWVWGYPMALALMAAVAFLPWLWIRRKGWL